MQHLSGSARITRITLLALRRGLLRFFLVAFLICTSGGCSFLFESDGRRSTTPSFRHTVKYPGETLSIISLWYIGRSAEWKKIAAINPRIQAGKLRVGDTIFIPISLAKRRDPLPATFLQSHIPTKSDGQGSSQSVTIKDDTVTAPPKGEITERKRAVLEELMD